MSDRDEHGPDRMAWKAAVRESDLPAPSKLLLFVLESRMSVKSPRPFPSVDTLAADTGLGRSTVLKHLDRLTDRREAGGQFVRKGHRFDEHGRQTSNEYCLVLTDSEGRVHEIDPGVQQLDPRGSTSWTGEGPANGPEVERKKKKQEDGGLEPAVRKVWKHYVGCYAHRYSERRAERLKLDAAGRPGKVRARLREGYTPGELCTAIDGIFGDDWHRDRDKHDLEYILRDQSKVEDFLNRAERNGGPGGHEAPDRRAVLDALDGGSDE